MSDIPDPPVTPATEIIETAGVEYRLVYSGPVRSAAEAAHRRGIPLARLGKTLVVRTGKGSYVLVVIPGDTSLDYSRLRAHLGLRRLTMPDRAEAQTATGYVPGAITPLGAGGLPVIVDRHLAGLDEISIGSGVRGWAIHLAAADLLRLTDADVAGVTSSPGGTMPPH